MTSFKEIKSGLILLAMLLLLVIPATYRALWSILLVGILVFIIAIIFPDPLIDFLRKSAQSRNHTLLGNILFIVSAYIILWANAIHERIIPEITRYYLFSEWYKNDMSHIRFKRVNAFMRSLKSFAAARHMPIVIRVAGRDGPYMFLFAVKVGPYPGGKELFLRKLESTLQKKYPDLYVRNAPGGFRILLPAEQFGV